MIKELGVVNLRSGEKMSVKCIEPPEEEYSRKLMKFLLPMLASGASWLRDVEQRLKGNYVKFCIDRYFVGEIRGSIIAQLWYGLPKSGTGMGNFGHVYTDPEYRRKGVVNELMKFCIADFQKSQGVALFCGTETPWIAQIYMKYGFRLINEGSIKGPMVLIKPEYARNFRELEERYFEPGLEINVRQGNVRDQFDCDKVLECSNGLVKLSQNWHRVFLASQIASFREVLLKVEDREGLVTVMDTSKGNIVGYAFILNIGSSIEKKSKTLDFVIHPHYLEKTVQFLQDTLEIAKRKGIENISCYVSSSDREKISALLKAGFKKESVLHNYCFFDDRHFDLVIFYYKNPDIRYGDRKEFL